MASKLNIRETKGVIIVDASGRVTLGQGAGELRETLHELSSAGHRHMVLNLEHVSYIDSAGIGVLVAAFATLRNLGGRLELLKLSTRVKDLLLITKLYSVFEIFEDEATALASFAEAEASTGGR